jgi:uncharacterized protein (DUF1697 family)
VTHVTYVGLLRGINVGRSTRVAMADLRALGDSATMRNWATVGKLLALSANVRR